MYLWHKPSKWQKTMEMKIFLFPSPDGDFLHVNQDLTYLTDNAFTV